jgi:hypothetical protein
MGLWERHKENAALRTRLLLPVFGVLVFLVGITGQPKEWDLVVVGLVWTLVVVAVVVAKRRRRFEDEDDPAGAQPGPAARDENPDTTGSAAKPQMPQRFDGRWPA